MFARSAAADCDDNLELVPIGDAGCRELPAWHDLAIAFDRDPLADKPKLFDELCESERLLELAALAVDGYRNHYREARSQNQNRGQTTISAQKPWSVPGFGCVCA